jgi:hypothetical protein
MQVGKTYSVEVIRTGNIVTMKVLGKSIGSYKIQFDTEPAQWYRKGMFRGRDPIYKVLKKL